MLQVYPKVNRHIQNRLRLSVILVGQLPASNSTLCPLGKKVRRTVFGPSSVLFPAESILYLRHFLPSILSIDIVDLRSS